MKSLTQSHTQKEKGVNPYESTPCYFWPQHGLEITCNIMK